MNQTFAEVITIGDEILYGQIVDTNSQWISRELDNLGIITVRKTTVPDSEQEILNALADATKRADLILLTGGLGPTNDDLTTPSLSKFFHTTLELNPEALEGIEQIFKKIGRPLTDTNRQQAYLPKNCQVVKNRAGTAPGMWFQELGKIYVSMPGVPHEMKIMMREQILPQLRDHFNTPTIYHKMVKTIGIGESWLSDKLKTWEHQLPDHIRLAYLPGLGEVRLRLTAIGQDASLLEQEVEQEIEQLKMVVGKYIYGYNNETLAEVVGNQLRTRKLTIAAAESCSGGKVSQALTSVPGSSDYFTGSIVAYQNRLKESLLGVKPETINSYGAVSEQTVTEMANGVRLGLNSDIGIATSGIAGPGGGSPEKPVGTVWIACADGNETISRKLNLYKDRSINIQLTTNAILNLVRQRIMEMDGETA